MAEMGLVNITEKVVELLLDQVIKKEGACSCEKCRLDIKALALNMLPPKYVVSEKGGAFETFRLGMMQNRVDIYQAILEAAHRVKARPRHDDTQRFQD